MKSKIALSSLALTFSVGFFTEESFAATSFKDIPTPQSHWAYDAVYWAVDKGITNGYSDRTFKPNNYISEAEFLAFLLNAFPNVQLTNLESGHWADKFYEYSHQYELPLTENRNQPITRGQVARLIAATLGLDYNQTRSIEYLFERGLSNGKSGKKTIEDYEAGSKMTRAEAVQFLKNLYSKFSGSPKFIGLKPIGGNHADFLRKVKNTVQNQGYDIEIKEQSGDFNIANKIMKNNKVTIQTVLSYTRPSSDDQNHFIYINDLQDPQLINLAKNLMVLIGVPANEGFVNEVKASGINGSTSNGFFGNFSIEFKGDKENGKVTVRFRKVQSIGAN